MAIWREWVWIAGDAPQGIRWQRGILEALAQARALASTSTGGIRVVLFGAKQIPASQLDELLGYGADCVTVVHSPQLEHPDAGGRLHAIEATLNRGAPQVLLIPPGEDSAVWAARLAIRRRLAIVPGCIEATASPKRLRVRTKGCRGALQLILEFDLASVPAPVILLPEPRSWIIPKSTATPSEGSMDGARIEAIELPGFAETGQVERLGRIHPDPGRIDLADADLVLGGGAGLQSSEGFAHLRAVAYRLNAAVGASRIAVDRGWARPDEMIGLTGRRITPRVYAAFGISGAREHLAGVTEAEHIIAVNIDRSAPVATVSEVVAVAEGRAVLSALAAEMDSATARGHPEGRCRERGT